MNRVRELLHVVGKIISQKIWIGMSCLWVLVSGCSSFEASRKMDMGPFADNTSSMFADAQKVARPMTWVYLKPYQDLPAVTQLKINAAPILKSLHAVLMYSNQLVALNGAKFSDREKNDRLAAYLSEATKSAVNSGKIQETGLTVSDLDTVFMNIRASKTFLDGIGAASPLVNAIVVTMDQNLEDLYDATNVAISAIDERIESDHATARRNLFHLNRLQNKSLRDATLLYDYKFGNQPSLDSLLQEDASMKTLFESSRSTSTNVIYAMEKALKESTSGLKAYIDQIQPEIELYSAKEKELEEIRVNVETRIKLARGAMMVWGQSHRNLGAGIPVPPLIDIMAALGGLVKKAEP